MATEKIIIALLLYSGLFYFSCLLAKELKYRFVMTLFALEFAPVTKYKHIFFYFDI